MSISSLISDIKTKIFGSDKPKLEKIHPKIDNEFIPNCEYMPDLEAGEGGFYRRLKQRQMDLELYSKPKNWDPEKCDKSIICGEVVLDVNGYENCKIIENYMSFMDVVNYFATPVDQRSSQNLPLSMEGIILPAESRSISHIVIDTQEEYPDVPLHLCRSNIL
jgi:hypothetical protein